MQFIQQGTVQNMDLGKATTGHLRKFSRTVSWAALLGLKHRH